MIQKQTHNFLKCNLCSQQAQKAKMCVHCSKIGCYPCLKTWFQQCNFACPFCDTQTTLNSFADCQRFMNQIKQRLSNTQQRNSLKQIDKNICPKHQLQMRYFCQTCNTPFCSDCKTFQQAHANHKLSSLSRLQQSKKEKINQQLKRFENKSKQFLQNGFKIKAKFDELIESKKSKKLFLQNYLRESLDELDKQYIQKQNLLQLKLQNIEEQKQLLLSLKQILIGDLKSSSLQLTNQKSEQYLGLIQSVCNRQININKNSSLSIFASSPEYHCYSYQLHQFSKIKTEIVYSQGYILNGIQWRLKIYPKGNGNSKDQFLAIFLQMTNAYQNKKQYQYKIQLINQLNQSESLARQYISIFDIGQCWGYNQFIELDSLDTGYLEDNTLFFKFYIRPKGFKNQAIDQHNYIRKLQSQIKQMKKQLEMVNRIQPEIIKKRICLLTNQKKQIHQIQLQRKKSPRNIQTSLKNHSYQQKKQYH